MPTIIDANRGWSQMVKLFPSSLMSFQIRHCLPPLSLDPSRPMVTVLDARCTTLTWSQFTILGSSLPSRLTPRS
jgi:hypothetical protein